MALMVFTAFLQRSTWGIPWGTALPRRGFDSDTHGQLIFDTFLSVMKPSLFSHQVQLYVYY
jgi:hypothetical protein